MAMRKLWRILAIACTSAALGTALSATRAVESVDRPLLDASIRLAARFQPPPLADLPDVTLVEIDPRSLRAFPEWPWSRARYAELTQRLFAANARVVVFDIDLSTARDAAGDSAFADAIRAGGPVVLAALRQRQQVAGVGALEIVNWPIAALLDAGARVGHVVVPIDSDGVVRRAYAAAELGGRRVDSLPLAALRQIGSRPAPLPTAVHRIDFRRAAPPVPQLSFADVVENRFDPAAVAGRVVFVGATASEFQDLWTTPIGPARAGVWIQAIEYRALAAAAEGAEPLTTPSLGLRFALLCLLAAAAQALSGARAALRLGGFAALSGGTVALCACAPLAASVLLSPAVPLATLAAHYAAGIERVRRTLGVRLASRELSLATLHDVGESTAQVADEFGIEASLVLLGRVVNAHAVALLRATPAGRLDGSRADWRPHGELAAVDVATAEDVLRRRALRSLSEIPGRPGVPGRAIYVPLLAGRVAVGVLVVESRATQGLADLELRTVATVASQLALTVRSLRLMEELRATLDASVEAIASAVEARDGYTEMHCRRLALFSVSMARRLELPPEEIEAIRLGALLHDVGKIGVRDHILLKAGRFSPDERVEMERHVEIGHRIVLPISGLADTTSACVRHHHEKWDGSGYPDRLAREAIPLGARIVAVVDVWDALSTARPYKPAYPQAKVREILEKDRGVHFEPALVDLFLRVLDEEGDEMLALIADSEGIGR
jgi:HD-GYP domain-containing protein (c-di-GMP phosphodiesterase class II)/CHASE2 domain-containing sensor protein